MANKKTSLFTWGLLGAGIALVISAFSKPPKEEPTNNNNSNYSNNNDFPIKWMKKSEAFKQVQKLIGVSQDGVFGDDSLKALQKFKPWYTKDYIISNQTQLQYLIDEIKKAISSTSMPTTNQPAISRAKQIFNAATLQNKNLILLQSGIFDVGIIDGFGAFVKQTTTRLYKGGVIKGTSLKAWSTNYLYVKTFDNKLIQIPQQTLTIQ